MEEERQIIGSLLVDASRLDDVSYINAEMFTDPTLAKIFAIYANANGKEVNPLSIVPQIVEWYQDEQQCRELIATLASEHDLSISDEYCADTILQKYKVRKVNELIQHTLITPNSVDAFMDDIKQLSELLVKEEDEKALSMSDLVGFSGEYFNENHKPKFKTGLTELDTAIGGIDNGDVTIIAARPSVGKSAFALQLGRKYGRDGYKVGYFNLEMGVKQIYERAIASASGIEMTRIRMATNFLNDEQAQFEQGNKELEKENNFFLFTGTFTIKKIRAKQQKEKFNIIIIDYLQLIVPSGKRNGNRAAEVGDISRGLKAIATDFDIPVIALSQLNRVSEHTKDKEPHLADLRESGDIEQDASNVLMMWNSNEQDATEKMMKVEKSRNGSNEKLQLYFDGKHMKFESANEDSDFRDPRKDEEIVW